MSETSVPEPLRADRAPANAPLALRDAVLAIAFTVATVVLLLLGARDTYRSIRLSSDGAVVSAQVLTVRYGSRADEVLVRLPAPINRDVDLVAWAGQPRVGDVIAVRYERGNSGLAEQEGSWPWGGILAGFLGALPFAFFAWSKAFGDRRL